MSSTVFILTPDTNGTVGGVKVHYQTVDALNALGQRAVVVHGNTGFRCTWFANETPVVGAESVQLRANDVVVVPEEWVQHIPSMPPEVDKVIFNQNAFTTFLWGQPWSLVRAVYARDDVRRVVMVSDDNLDYIRYVFPGVATAAIQQVIDPATFYVDSSKTRSVAYMPRKRPDEAAEVLAILGARGALDGWEVVAIAGRSEAQTAAIMRRASVFLSFSRREGQPLPPAEALACGCVVAGFHGFGGRDISPHALWVSDGDVLGFAQTVERVLTSWDTEAERWSRLASDSASHVRSKYAPARFHESVGAAFEGLGATEDTRIVGQLPSDCWRKGPLPSRVMRRLQMAARVAVKGQM